MEYLARPLVGYRIWKADKTLLPVERYGDQGTWLTRTARAGCQGQPGLCANASECMCGLHIYSYPRWADGSYVSGAVVAWGRIIEHQSGFRAEYARPIAFLEPTHHPMCAAGSAYEVYSIRLSCDCRSDNDLAERMSERYEVPLLNSNELSAYMSWFGDPCGPQENVLY